MSTGSTCDRCWQGRSSIAIIPQICEALQFAHDAGIVHREIKPENILLDRKGKVKIADFGLAKLAGGAAGDFTLTGTHQVMGTPRYMAPEQMEGSHHVDHRADIYSLGVVFYEMLTGEVPMGRFDPPSHKTHVDAQLDEVVLKTLAREPDRRYQQASQIKSDIELLSGAQATVAANYVASNHIAELNQKFTSPPDLDDIDDARRQVQGPAIGLIVAGILNFAPILGLLWLPGFLEILILAISLPVGILMIIGGLKMLRLESHGLAMTVSVLALLPLTGCLIGIPMAIWSLVVLGRPEVKAAFANQRSDSYEPPPLPKKPRPLEDDWVSDDDRQRIKRMVLGPAIGLMIVGLLDLLPLLLAVLLMPVSRQSLSSVPFIATTWPISQAGLLAHQSTFGFDFAYVLLLIPLVLGIPLAGMLILGGWKMKQLQLFRLAIVVSVIACLPCHLGFILGVPVGLWSLAVLSREEVKAAFE
jgi:serine/threonine protein kinase